MSAQRIAPSPEIRARPAGLAYCDARGRIFFDVRSTPYADGGSVRRPCAGELIAAPPGCVPIMLPGRRPMVASRGDVERRGPRAALRRTALAVALPAGYTRLLLPAYVREPGAPPLPLFGYTFAAVVDDELHVAAMRTDEDPDWSPRFFGEGELERAIARRRSADTANPVLAQLEICAREYGCFTAQNVFLQRGEAALPVSPRCNARCLGCISELEPAAGIPAPQTRIAYEASAAALARVALGHLAAVPDGIVSFGQGCEGEPLLRIGLIERTIGRVRAATAAGTINLNTNGSLPRALQRAIDAGLQAVRISLNSFRPRVYAAYYRPAGYDLDDVLESVRVASAGGLRVSLNLLTHPGVTDDEEEVAAAGAFLSGVRVDMIQTRTLNIDPEAYFDAVGRPQRTLGMRAALEALRARGVRLGNFTHTH